MPPRPHTGQWSLYNERNTPMSEIWVYGVSATPTKVYFAVWGSGLLEYTRRPRRWDKYEDPDGENEMVLFKDQGLIHEIVTSVSYVDNIVWAATYFGDSRYDGRYWHNFLTKDSGLPSNFTNFVKGVDAHRAWFCTDKGLAYYDGANWAVYRPSLTTGKPQMSVRDAQGRVTQSPVTTAPAHNYILGIDFQGNDIWVATAKGLSHGILQQTQFSERIRSHHHERICGNSGIYRARTDRKRAMTNHGVLNEAFAYAKPSSFSRGMRIDLGGSPFCSSPVPHRSTRTV